MPVGEIQNHKAGELELTKYFDAKKCKQSVSLGVCVLLTAQRESSSTRNSSS